jgi:hypothetical protein
MQRSALVSRRTPQRARTRVGWTLLHRCAAGVGWDLVRMNQRTSFARSKRWCTSWKGGVVLTRPLTATFSSVVKKEIQRYLSVVIITLRILKRTRCQQIAASL